eukprot:scaffold9132_cov84-Skeletonema_dohrnii-CCMP3373.AAC.2
MHAHSTQATNDLWRCFVSVITRTLTNVYARVNRATAVVIALVVHTVYACTGAKVHTSYHQPSPLSVQSTVAVITRHSQPCAS